MICSFVKELSVYWFATSEIDKVISDLEIVSRCLLDLFKSESFGDFSAHKFSIDVSEHSLFSDQSADDSLTSQGQFAFLEHLGFSVLAIMFHQHNDGRAAGHEIHGTTHTLDELSWNDPVSDITSAADLHGTKHGHV